MTPNDTKKGSFLDRFSGKNAASSTNTNDSMFLNTDLIHEGISDDDLDLLLSGDIKSSANPPKNPLPAEFTEEELAMDDLDDMLELAEVDDALDINTLSADETLDLDEDELLGLDALDAVLAADTSEPEATEALSTEAMSTDAVTTEAVPQATMPQATTSQTAVPQAVQSPALSSLQSSSLQSSSVQSDSIPKEIGDVSPLAGMEVVDLITPLSEQNLDKQSSQPAATAEQAATNATETDALELEAVPLTATPVVAQTTADISQSDTLEIQAVEFAEPEAATVEIKAITPEVLSSEEVHVPELVSITDTTETAEPEATETETTLEPKEVAAEPQEAVLESDIPALDVTVETPAISTEQIQAKQAEEKVTTPAESMKAQLTSALPSVSASVLATGAVTAAGGSLAATSSSASSSISAAQPSPEKPASVPASTEPEVAATVSEASESKQSESTEEAPVQSPAQSSTQSSVQVVTAQASGSITESAAASTTSQSTGKDDTAELKTVLHPIPDSVKSRLNSSDDSVKAEKPASATPAVSIAAVKPHTPKPATGSASKVTFNKPSGKNTMTNDNQTALLEKVQVDIDELKRKLHSMNSDFYNAATDSAVLISQVRELETKSAGDFNGTYTQSRELRRLLVDARKIFNQLASGIDMLEESLETDLYAVEKKA